MVTKNEVVEYLNDYFSIEKYGPDPTMSRMVPLVYGVENCQEYFAKDFLSLFNGLMISGSNEVNHFFGAVFPTEETLRDFINESVPGDLLFLHHPLDMECGDPQGEFGRAFLPINIELLQKIKEKELSIYSCHHPLDCNDKISTGLAIAKKLGLMNIKPCVEIAGEFVGLIGEIEQVTANELIEKLKEIFELPYLDLGGHNDDIKKIVIVAGSGDKVDFFKEAESLGADAYVTGEIHSHIDNEKGRVKMKESLEYIKDSNMSFFGVSHAASEFLVIKDAILPLLSDKFKLPTKDLKMTNWWH